MGNNAAYGQWEHTVIELKKAGVLTPELLDAISKYHEGTDIDSGGSADLEVDGHTVEEICVLTFNPDFKPVKPNDIDADDEYWEGDAWYEAFEELSDRWGWR